MRKEAVVLIVLLALSIPATGALLTPGGFTSHDLTHHVIRQISMDRLLSEGQFPPRWSGELNNDYGYPVFLFNYPLPAMVGEIFHKLGFGYVDSVKAVLFSSMILSTLGMYLFLSSLLKNKLAAFLGAVFYLYAPIRFLNVYVSASVGSALALGIVPFVFWAITIIARGPAGSISRRASSLANRSLRLRVGTPFSPSPLASLGILLGALSLAGLILAHNVTSLIFAPVILVFSWILVREVSPSTTSASLSTSSLRVKEIGMMILLGLGLSAWFWLPAILEKQYTRFDLIFSSFYKDQFVNIWQLLRSPWGYGLSHPQNPEPGDMSYQLGLVHILVMLVLVVLWWVRREVREVRVIGGFVLLLFIVSVLLMLNISLPLWERLPFLSLVQFPLRFSAIAIFSASIAAALLVKWIPHQNRCGMTGRKIVFVTLLILVVYANRNHWNVNEKFDPGEDYYLNLKTTSTTYGEHLPKWGRAMEREATAKLEIIRGIGKIRVMRDQSALFLAEVESSEAAKLRFNQFYFPGWQIKVDDKPVSFNYLVDGESYGLPLFDIEKGKHLVEAEFKNTPARNLADGISIVTGIMFIIVICKLLLRNLSKAKRFF